MPRRRAELLLFVIGVGSFALAMVAGASQALRTAKALPGIALLDSLAEARSRHELGEERVLREYRVASHLALGDQRVFEEYAAALVRSGDRGAELAVRLRAREHWPESAPVHIALGYSFLANQLADEALDSFGSAVRLDPFSWAAHAGRGDALRARGRAVDAIAAYQSAIRMAPLRPGLHQKLGATYALVGRRDEAAQEFTEAHRLDPAMPGAEASLDRVAGPGERAP